ncbi:MULTISPECIES: hypothetical protein [Bradyrhizobium]|jgi:hypothetical protein|uniref:Uncharacterized protein n=2 Tax=Bradyrhizobium TaxID=374 RepID=A0ABS5G4L5_9BRAD|nr:MULTISPECIES: hypothetical protein [unclassified Bradyrhizobium]MBR1136258.1 hypothetical protein [Bradyrhizobium denitrificans]MDU1492701.1 hypothetical protein [Bradyrhizobium sp.]MDU1543175.1 hypothetical protein [Bradyrhizobium sp.]MDU1667016.1 hypothetical protein [Bradyrhizobium sp.]MDU1688830.1 hypothetical protein [Bradyrhizobium sp.]
MVMIVLFGVSVMMSARPAPLGYLDDATMDKRSAKIKYAARTRLCFEFPPRRMQRSTSH